MLMRSNWFTDAADLLLNSQPSQLKAAGIACKFLKPVFSKLAKNLKYLNKWIFCTVYKYVQASLINTQWKVPSGKCTTHCRPWLKITATAERWIDFFFILEAVLIAKIDFISKVIFTEVVFITEVVIISEVVIFLRLSLMLRFSSVLR